MVANMSMTNHKKDTAEQISNMEIQRQKNETEIKDLNGVIAARDQTIKEREQTIQEREQTIQERDDEIADLKDKKKALESTIDEICQKAGRLCPSILGNYTIDDKNSSFVNLKSNLAQIEDAMDTIYNTMTAKIA